MISPSIQTHKDIPDAAYIISEAVREDGKIWVRYIGSEGPQANTVLGNLWQGDCVLFSLHDNELYPGGTEEDTLAFLLSSGQWMPLIRGRCSGTMRISGERCLQECHMGEDVCPLHLRDREMETKKGRDENG